MYFYALIDTVNNSVIRVFQHKRDDLHIAYENHVQIESLDHSYYGRIYDRENKCWTDEWFTQPKAEPTQLDRIESMVAKSQEQIAQEARDAYTLELIEGGVIA